MRTLLLIPVIGLFLFAFSAPQAFAENKAIADTPHRPIVPSAQSYSVKGNRFCETPFGKPNGICGDIFCKPKDECTEIRGKKYNNVFLEYAYGRSFAPESNFKNFPSEEK